MSAPAYVIRPAGPGDYADVLDLRDLAGPGFTSLAVPDAALAAKLEQSAASFAAEVSAPRPQERYLLALESLAEGRVVGLAGVKAAVGIEQPFFNFRLLKIAQASLAAGRRFDLDVLILVNEFMGCSEVGTLFVRAEHRAGGIGRALAQSRYMLIASAPHRFSETIVSELRGVVAPDGSAPFWEHLGRKFFRMSFDEADRLSATTDNQFILDLMPKYPIYADLLPEAARAVIGQTHPDGAGARRLLEWEGFRFADVIDIFDGGPLMRGARDSLRTVREQRLRAVSIGQRHGRRGLVARGAFSQFRCVPTHVAESSDGGVSVAAEPLEALHVTPGETVRVWISDAH